MTDEPELKVKKMTKLVRFIDSDGKTRIVEEKDAPSSPRYVCLHV
jgi:hypothetical protein